MGTVQAIRPGYSAPMSSIATTSLVPRSESLAGSVLAVLPAVYGVTLVLPVAGYDWNPVEYAIIGLSFYLASVALAAVDERSLRALGVVQPATAYWSLLTAVPYLAARTRVLAEQDRVGLGLLWVAIVSSLCVMVTLVLIGLA
jgi:hypothetical protein